ncbi:MAG: GH3 auxin-responsive promoter family protein [Acidobacteriota bacterium]
MNALLWALQSGHALSLKPAAKALHTAFQDPAAAQHARWQRLIQANALSDYGRQHGFDRIHSMADYQRKVPVVDYEAVQPWIDRIAMGEQAVLTQAPVRMLEPSGGSTSTNKYIPYTDDLLEDFARATNPWLHDLFSHVKGLKGTQSYWSISLAKQGIRQTERGVPIGFDDDTEYFSPLMRWALNRMMAVPNTVAQAADMDAWRWQTCLHLLRSESLGLISVWSPTYLSLLMGYISHNLDVLLPALPAKRAQRIRHAIDQAGRLTGEALWPHLKLISCWTDSIAADFLPALQQWFPHTPLQGKGLLATEGVVSAPLLPEDGTGCPLAINSHFLEFVDLDHPARSPLLAHELRQGGAYSPILSTGGGLYRYHLKDVIHCVGHVAATPKVRFGGKLDRVSDLCGEKVHASQVEAALAQARHSTGARWHFAMLAPVRGPSPHYRLFIDGDLSADLLAGIGQQVESHLATGHHYAACRRLGQLGPLQAQAVAHGWQIFQRTLVAAGQRAGDIKPTALDARHDWVKAFSTSEKGQAGVC